MKRKRYIVTVLLLLAMMVMLTACESKTNSVRQQIANDASVDSQELTAVAVVVAVDGDAKTITLRDVETQEEQTLPYNGATMVYNKSKAGIVMTQLACGEIVEATYGATERVLTEVRVSQDAWEYSSVDAKNIDRTDSTITVTGRKYQYASSGVAVFDGSDALMLMDLNEQDEVTIKGIGTQVYSFMITKSHGYIRLGGQDAFLGGTIEVDQNLFADVQSNMLLTVGEGEHTIVLRNGALEAVETVTVEKNQEYFLDLSGYEQPDDQMGRIKFVITPSDAALYINGKLRNANQILSLPYGNYNVAVIADGYEDYTGILRVQESASEYETIYVDLVESGDASLTTATPSATDDAKEEDTDSADDTEGTQTPTIAPTATVAADEKHTITVNSPAGASVYVNGVYQGVAPVTFEKVTGEITLTLSQEGYMTKSYTVTVADDGEDVEYSFASLVKK